MTSLERELRAMIERIVDERVERRLAELRPQRREVGELMSTTEAATFARVTTATIRRWIRRGKLTRHGAGRMVRVRRNDVESLLRERVGDDSLTPEQLADRDFG